LRRACRAGGINQEFSAHGEGKRHSRTSQFNPREWIRTPLILACAKRAKGSAISPARITTTAWIGLPKGCGAVLPVENAALTSKKKKTLQAEELKEQPEQETGSEEREARSAEQQ